MSPSPRRLFRQKLQAGGIFLFCLGVMLYMWHWVENRRTAELQYLFGVESREIAFALENRMGLYANTLYAGQALFATSEEVTLAEWKTFLEEGNWHERYPGIRVSRFIEKVPAAQKNAFVERMRADLAVLAPGLPPFEILPSGEHPEYFVAKYAEPIDNRFMPLGYDFGALPDRLDAMNRAAGSGRFGATDALYETEEGQQRPRIQIFVPVYSDKKNGGRRRFHERDDRPHRFHNLRPAAKQSVPV